MYTRHNMSRKRVTTGTSICQCGTKKQCWALTCAKCRILLNRPTIDPQIYIIDGKPARKLRLTNGLYAIVDEWRYEELDEFCWQAAWSTTGKQFRAQRRATPGELESKWPGTIMLHRFVKGVKDNSIELDHKNVDPLDNREDNLRPASGSQNCMNKRTRLDSKTGIKGVQEYSPGKFRAYIDVKGMKRVMTPILYSLEEAIEARIALSNRYHDPKFAREMERAKR